MESKVNYTLVGLFVLLLGAAAIIIPLWLSSGLNQQKYKTYVVVLDEAVDGLSLNAPVNYNGVNVGYVRDVRLNPNKPEEVELFLNIKLDTPITTNTTATLQNQGVTGFTYIGLKGGTVLGAQPLVANPGQLYPQIKALPSIRVKLDTALNQLMTNFDNITKQLNNVFTPENEKLLNSTLANTNKLAANLDQQAQIFNQNTSVAINQLQGVLNNLNAITEEVKQNPSIMIRGKANPSLGPGENQ